MRTFLIQVGVVLGAIGMGFVLGTIAFVLTHPYICKNPECRYNRWWFV